MSESVNAFVLADSYLTLHYRVTLLSGTGAGSVFADTFTGRPGTLQMGSGQWAPAMETPLVGRHEGESFSYEVPASQAYGERNPELLQRVSLGLLQEHGGEDANFKPGDLVEFAAPNGGSYSGVLRELDDDWALFDFNHPLSGADLKLDVSILGVL